MKNPKLGQALFSLSDEEQAHFKEFLRLSRFSLPPGCLEWLEEFMAQGQNWPGPDAQYGGLDNATRNSWANQGLQIFRNYVRCFMVDGGSYDARFQFLEMAADSDWSKAFQADLKSLEADLQAEKGRDHAYAHHQLLLAEQKMIQAKQDRKTDDFAEAMAEAFKANEAGYLETRLRLLVELHNRSRIREASDPATLTEAELEAYSQHPSKGIQAYAGIYRMHTGQTVAAQDAAYQLVRNIVEEQAEKWHPNLLKAIIAYLMNHCLRRLSLGDEYFAQAYLDWVSWRAKKQLLLERNHLSFVSFRNLIEAAIMIGDIPQVERCLVNYGPMLHPDYQEASGQIGRAKLAFHQRAYSSVRTELATCTPKKEAYILQVDIHRLSLKTYLEDPNGGDFDAMVKNMRQYVKRHKIMTSVKKERLLTFVNVCERLDQRRKLSPKRRQQLETELIPQAPLPDQPWLLRKLRQREDH